MAKRIAVLVNPTTGKGRGAREATRALIRLRELGCDVTELVGADGADAVLLARRAVHDGYDALVAVGGDGMVHLVLQAVAGTSVPLGIVAAGSGNDFATTLGLPLHDARAAADIVAAGFTRVADAGLVTGSNGSAPVWFACVLSSGFDSLVNERGNRMRWPRGPMRYNIATVAELRVFTPVPFTFAVDGVQTQQSAMFVAVGNAPSYGGGMRICPAAEIDDGQFAVTVVGAVGKARFLRLFPSVFKGTHVEQPEVSVHIARTVDIDAPGMVAFADGELVGPLPVSVECIPGAVTLLVPGEAGARLT